VSNPLTLSAPLARTHTHATVLIVECM